MGFFKALFSTPTGVLKVIDAGAATIDAAFHTKAPKNEFLLKWLQATGPSNLARRVIAFIVAIVWGLSALACLTLIIATEDGKDVLDFMDKVVNSAFMLIMLFYFAPTMLSSLKLDQVFGKKK